MSNIKICPRVSISSLTLEFNNQGTLDANNLTKTGDRVFHRGWHFMILSSYGASAVSPRKLLLTEEI